MKICTKDSAIHLDAGRVTEYPLDDKAISFSIVRINGRNPAKKFIINESCKELVHVTEGQGKIIVNGREQKLKTGDVVLIEAGEKIAWEGTITLMAICTPAWSKDQHTIVD